MRSQDRRTLSRAEIASRHCELSQISPEVGSLDEQAMAEMLAGDTDEGLSLLVDLAKATDRELRKRARQLAAALLVPVARTPGQ